MTSQEIARVKVSGPMARAAMENAEREDPDFGPPAVRKTEVECELREYEAQMDRLQKAVDGLVTRLAAVVHPYPVNPIGAATTEANLVPLAQILRNRNRELAEYVDRLESLRGAIEL